MYAFTDSSPFRELAIFVAIFAASIGAVLHPTVARGIDAALMALVRWVRGRGLFTVERVEVEQRRLDLLRIVLGLLVTYRTGGNLQTALNGGDPQTVALMAVAWALCLLLLVGLATPLVSLALMLTINLVLDNMTFTSTLSSVVLAMNLMVVTFAPCGRSLSLDAPILRRPDGLGRVWRGMYNLFGSLSLERSAVLKWCLLLAYAGINFSSSLMHLMTETWMSGLTIAWVLLDPVTSPSSYTLGNWAYATSPLAYLILTGAMTYGILIFQFGLLPLVLLSRWTRLMVTVLELAFVLGGTILIAIQMLGIYQTVSLAILFWNRFKLNRGGADEVAVVYDDAHGPTRALVRAACALDLFFVIDAQPRSAAAFERGQRFERGWRAVGVDRAGRAYTDLALARVLAERVLLLLPLWPFAVVGQWLSRSASPAPVTPVAARDLPPSAACTGTPAGESPSPVPVAGGAFTPALRGYAVCFLIMFLAFVPRMLQPTRLPGITFTPPFHPANSELIAQLAEVSKQTFGQAPVVFGMMQVNAFN